MKKHLFLVLLLALHVSGHAKKKHHLELHLEQGQVYSQMTHARMQMVQKVMGQEMNIDIEIDGSMAFEVMEVQDDQYQMEAWYESLDMGMDIRMGEMQMNSDGDEMGVMMSQLLKSMTGIRFHLGMNKLGRVSEVRGVSEILDKVMAQIEDVPETQLSQIRQQMETSFSDKALVGSIQAVTAVFPRQAVRVGDSWEVNTSLQSGFAMDMQSTYVLEAAEKDHYLLRGTSSLKSVAGDEYQQVNGMDMRYDMAGSSSAEIKLDPQTGWVLNAQMAQELKGMVQIKANEQIPDGFELPMSISSDTRISGQ